jgi:Replication-relaxation
VLLNDSLRVDLDEVISAGQVLVVKGALGAMGAGNTSVLMQLLVGMLDAALARRQDSVPVEQRMAVALKIDEAPLVINRGFAETLALKRSAGLETVACWQADAQWIDRDIRAQLDALFAHRVYFATASVGDAREAASLMMAEFSDTVRPGIRNLSDLGHPDVRLRLPRHSAIVSWVTPEGRQVPFVAHTLPLRVDEQRLALHAARQTERGGLFREDLSQPHWQRREQDREADRAKAEPPSAPPADTGAKRAPPAESYSELVGLDAAHSVRWAKPATAVSTLEPEPLDIEILALIASMRHVLSSQIHRRFNSGRAATTTQRRLKRLADADLVARFQFHRRDGGGVPMCYSITSSGLRLSREHDDSPEREPVRGKDAGGHEPFSHNLPQGDQLLRQARRDVHVAGWALALQRALADRRFELLGPYESQISPPSSSSREGARAMLSLNELCLPGGRIPHDFLRTVESGRRVEVERFQSIRPDASLRTGEGQEILIELDDRLPEGLGAAKLERYDHFLTGWSAHLARYKRPEARAPTVVFVCRDAARARECARRADRVLTACRAYAGEYPVAWEYLGRERIVYVAECDIHQGLLCAWGLPRLPPEVRVAVAQGDPRARDPVVERRDLTAA